MAACVGVDARWSATRSEIETSDSCPIAETSGTGEGPRCDAGRVLRDSWIAATASRWRTESPSDPPPREDDRVDPEASGVRAS